LKTITTIAIAPTLTGVIVAVVTASPLYLHESLLVTAVTVSLLLPLRQQKLLLRQQKLLLRQQNRTPCGLHLRRSCNGMLLRRHDEMF
jgi:hypothetical protein